MPLNLRVTLGLLIASALAYVATPLAIRVASRLDFFDRPRGYRGHAVPTPYLGGAAVCLAFVAAAWTLTVDASRTLPLVAGTAVLWAVGTADDRSEISPAVRVAIEFALSAGLWALGLGWDLGLGPVVDLVATCLWIGAVINAFNLFDNMDGTSSTMAAVVAASMALLGCVRGDAWLGVTAGALAGACLGFLPHNVARPTARIFLGDGGSMPVGFVVATLIMLGTADATAPWQSLAVGLVLVGIPALDTTLVVISRRRRGISVLTGGRDHLTHRTRRRLKDVRVVAATLGGVQAVLSLLAIVALQGSSLAVVVLVIGYLVAAATTIAWMETVEERAAGESPTATATSDGSVARPPRRTRVAPAYVLLAVLGLGAALSPLAGGYYNASAWVPIGIGIVALLGAGLMARVPKISLPAALALVGYAGLGGWQLLSATWAESVHQAITEGNRTLVLAAVLGVGLIALRDERRTIWLTGTLTVGTVLVALTIVARMLGSSPTDLLVSGRLNEPLGYVNAEGTVMLLGAWGCLAAAERRSRILAGFGMSGAVALVGLAVMSQSRGAAAAALVSLLVVVVAVPGRRRRLLGLAVVAVALAAMLPLLLHVYDVQNDAVGTQAAALHHAAIAIVLAAVVAGVAWGLAVQRSEMLLAAGGQQVDRMRRAVTIGLVALGCVAVLAGVVKAGSLWGRAHDQYDAFVHLSDNARGGQTGATTSRLLSGGGNRYDYWRTGMDAYRTDPLVGVGAGNYDVTYFRERRTNEDVRQPHSIEVQALAETGLVGLALLLVFLVGVGLGARRLVRAARDDAATRTVAVAAIGGFVAWFVHTSADWMHLIPGVTAVALLYGAAILRHRPLAEAAAPVRAGDVPEAWRPRASFALPAWARLGGAAALAVLVLGIGASLGRQGLTDYYRTRATNALADDPAHALVEADRALRLDPTDVGSYYIKAAALARYDQGSAADRALHEALDREPHDFVTWALLGDLAARRGDVVTAARSYRMAMYLNPREASLAQSLADATRIP